MGTGMKLLIVDDHLLFREGLAAIIHSEPDIEICGMAGTVNEAVALAAATQPDIILMDHGLPDGTGVDATQQILAQSPHLKVIFLTMSEDDATLFSAVRSGAKGFLLKNMRPAALIEALRSVYRGESALSPQMTLRVMGELTRSKPSVKPDDVLGKLTNREMEILIELAAGNTNQQIADHLFLSENTIKHHLHSIFEKLNLFDRKSVAAFARQHGLGK
jgi:DNA-binding NarL/FixJ family response regulator